MTIILKKIFILFAVLFIFAFADPTLTNALNFNDDSGLSESGGVAGYEKAGLSDISFTVLVGKIIRIFITLLGIFFLILMIYAGFVWMLSRGNSQDVEKAKKIMQNSVIGLIVILLAYGITVFVTNILMTPAVE